MYASQVGNQELTLFVSGNLWGSSLVMGDKETGSLWSHILGECMSGKLKGQRLEVIPSNITTWKNWKERHPDSTVTALDPTDLGFTTDYLTELDMFCVGLSRQGKARYWSLEKLQEYGRPVNDSLGPLQVVVHFEEEHATATIWDRTIGEQALVFAIEDSRVIDQQTGSTWDLARGTAIDGKLAGTRLKSTVAIPSFVNAWKRFHPDTTEWELIGLTPAP